MESKEKNSSTTKISEEYASKSLSKKEEDQKHVGQGELYSPEYAIKERQNNTSLPTSKEDMGVVEEIRKRVGIIKERVLEKLGAAADVPADALESARHFLETVVKDVSLAAHGLTKDALNRIKTHLVDILPSLSPAITSKMVDDAAKEADREKGEEERGNDPQSKQNVSPASSLFASRL